MHIIKLQTMEREKNGKDSDNVTNQVANTEWSSFTILCELNFLLFAFRKCVVIVCVLFDLFARPFIWSANQVVEHRKKLKSEWN